MNNWKSHLMPGEIRAYQDGVFQRNDNLRIEAHLSACADCQRLAEEIAETGTKTRLLFEKFEVPIGKPRIKSPQTAFAVFESRLERMKEEQPMKNIGFIHLPRTAWIALAVCLALAGALAFEPARTLANEFLALFRVEQVRVVQFDSEDLPQKLENSSQLEYIFSNDVQVEETGEARQVASLEEASALLSFPARLPTQIDEQPKFIVQPSGKLDMKIDLDLVRGVLKDIEREDIQLPDELDGAHISIEIPSGLAAYYGTCDLEIGEEPVDPDQPIKRSDWESCTTLMQIPSPVISAPPDLDLNKIGEAYLQILGMDAQEAASFASSVNWTSTFIVPIPRYSVDYEEAIVAGTKATLIYDKEGYNQHYLLLWIRDGVVFVLGGWGDKLEALQIANSIP